MTLEVHEWLPVEATASEAVRSRIGGAVSDWSGAWFSGRRVSATSFTPTRGVRSDAAAWRVYGAAVAFSCSKAALTRLAGWALDARLEHLVLNLVDQQLIAALEQRIIEDLASRVERSLELKSAGQGPRIAVNPFAPLGGLSVNLAEGQGGSLMAIGIPLAVLAPLCRGSAMPAGRSATPLGEVVEALGPTTISIDARLGLAELSLAELRGLAPGDVVVLDTRLDESAELFLSGSDQVIARARLTETEGRRAVALHA